MLKPVAECFTRESAERLVTLEVDAETRAKYVASFNRGYRAFSEIYVRCTASATEAIGRYMKEGEELARDTATRYGN